MSFIAVIPARRASTRLPDKPLLDLGGKPMVVRVAEAAALSGAAETIVATDDQEIAAICRSHGVLALLTRSDHPSGTDRIAEVVALRNLDDRAIIVNVQGDEPLIDPQLIRRCAATLADATECSIATASHRISDPEEFFNPNIVKVICDAKGRALYFSRAPIPWDRNAFADSKRPSSIHAQRHIGLYAYRAGFLRQFCELAPAPIEQAEMLEQLRALYHGFRIAVFEADHAPPAGVDTVEDLARVRALFARTIAPNGNS